MIQRNKLIGVIVSVAMALVGTGLLVAYVRGAHHQGLKSSEAVSVLVVSGPITKGTRADDIASKVKSAMVPANVVAKGAVTSIQALAGQVAIVDLQPGEQVLQSRFAPPTAAASAGIPPGLLQVTVPIDLARAVGGQIRAGDTVGVVASFDDPPTSRMILQKVLVTGVRTDAGVPVKTNAQDASPAAKGLFVTLALDAPSVERVVFAAEHGRLWLSQEPMDAPGTGTKIQDRTSVNA
jgi:pilus assembly protein CpaB